MTGLRWVRPAVVGGCAVAAATVIWFADPTTPGGLLPPCPTNALLHVNCPGCGMTRAVYSLMHGDVAAAMHYNAVGVIGLVLAATAMFVGWLRRRLGLGAPSWWNTRIVIATAVVVTLAWFVIRNIPVEPFVGLKV